MSKLIEILKALKPCFATQRDLDEAYLAQSADIYDLERRMEEVAVRACRAPAY
jgi:hypothetical protein